MKPVKIATEGKWEINKIQPYIPCQITIDAILFALTYAVFCQNLSI